MKHIFPLIFVIFFITCEKSFEPYEYFEFQLNDLDLEEIFEKAIYVYEEQNDLLKARALFEYVIDYDSCYCYWESYYYIASINIKIGKITEAKNGLLLAIKTFETKDKSISNGLKFKYEILFVDPSKQEIPVFVPYDTPPEPIGGLAAIQRNLIYPQDAKNQRIEDSIIIQCFVNNHGGVCKTELPKNPLLISMGKAAKKAVKSVKWKPAYQRDKPVSCWVRVVVVFKL